MKELIYHRGFVPAANFHADKTAVIDGGYRATFAQHADRVFRLTHALKNQLGVSKSDRFAVMALNNHAYLELYHAAFLGAGVINPLNLRLAGKELDYIVRDSGTEVVFVDQFFAETFAKAMQESEGPSPIRKVVLIGEGDGPCDLRYEDMLAAAEPEIPDEPEEDDPVVLMYTGGTTGLPKGVVVTQRAEMLNCYHAGMAFKFFEPGQVCLIQTPIFHAASMVSLLSTYTTGGVTVLIPMFDPGGVLSLMEEHQVSITIMVPTMIGMMVNHPDFKPERIQSLQSLTYGASPMPAVLLDKLLEMLPNLRIFQGYGMTESSSLVTCLTAEDHRVGGKRLRSVGRPVLGIQVCIQDEAGNVLPAGETGEVCARGGNFMTEYWNKREQTEKSFKGGWYHTGDAGYIDEDGYLFLVDRVKDMIITGGENVYSVEVENAISSHPAVAQVAVIGIPHDTWGEAVHAVVVTNDGHTVTEIDIITHARDSIAGYKVPKSVEFRSDPLPLSGAMKVLKKDLRAPHWEGREKSIG